MKPKMPLREFIKMVIGDICFIIAVLYFINLLTS